MKISLDSNVFSDQEFIDWLHINIDRFEIILSSIVTLETYHWFNLRNLSIDQFELEISKLKAKIVDLEQDQIYPISNNAKQSTLRFKHHARDFIIGTHSQLSNALFITSNTKHFDWMLVGSCMTPEDFVIMVETE